MVPIHLTVTLASVGCEACVTLGQAGENLQHSPGSFREYCVTDIAIDRIGTLRVEYRKEIRHLPTVRCRFQVGKSKESVRAGPSSTRKSIEALFAPQVSPKQSLALLYITFPISFEQKLQVTIPSHRISILSANHMVTALRTTPTKLVETRVAKHERRFHKQGEDR